MELLSRWQGTNGKKPFGRGRYRRWAYQLCIETAISKVHAIERGQIGNGSGLGEIQTPVVGSV